MLAFDIAREGNPAGVGGSATGLANTGGFTMAVATQLVAGRLLDSGVAAGIPVALLPMVALMALAAVMGARIIGATSRDARRTHGRELAREAA
jgi:hypothetical protein